MFTRSHRLSYGFRYAVPGWTRTSNLVLAMEVTHTITAATHIVVTEKNKKGVFTYKGSNPSITAVTSSRTQHIMLMERKARGNSSHPAPNGGRAGWPAGREFPGCQGGGVPPALLEA